MLHDEGLVTVVEPFQALKNQGQVLGLTPYRAPRPGETLGVGEDGILVPFAEAKEMPEADLTWRWTRMSKSKGNVVTPDEAVEQYGADALRLYLLFRAPFDADIQWESEGMRDTARFLSRVFRFAHAHQGAYTPLWRETLAGTELGPKGRKLRQITHATIRDVTGDIERFSFNTGVSWLMKAVNGLYALAPVDEPLTEDGIEAALSEAIESLILLLAPMAPHSADELWESLGKEGTTYEASWPTYDAALAAEDAVEIAVQVNGKLRDRMSAAPGTPREELEARARRLPNVLAHTEGKTVRKVVVVPDKLVNVVVG